MEVPPWGGGGHCRSDPLLPQAPHDLQEEAAMASQGGEVSKMRRDPPPQTVEDMA